MLEFMFRTLWDMLERLTSPALISAALLGLSSLLESPSPFETFVFKLDFVQGMIPERVDRPFPFLAAPECGRCRVALHRALSAILVHRDAAQVCKQYLATFNDALDQDEATLWGFLRDFAGFFRYARNCRDYSIFLNYLFANHLPKLVALVSPLKIAPGTINALLKMWSEMLRNEPQRIQFKRHSANGVILFHHTTNLICSLLDQLIQGFAIENEMCVKFLNFVFRILYSSLSATYIPFSIFDVFGDDSLKRMLTCYVKCTDLIPVDRIAKYPKVEATLQRLTRTIATRHMIVAFNPEVACQNLILLVLITGLESSDHEAVRCATDALRQLTDCPALTSLNRDTFVKATFKAWHLAFTRGPFQKDVADCIAHVLARDPESLELAFTRVREMAIEEKLPEVDECCADLLENLKEAFTAGEFQAAVGQIQNFVSRVTSLLKRPTAIFNV
jgi:hypothetical protein